MNTRQSALEVARSHNLFPKLIQICDLERQAAAISYFAGSILTSVVVPEAYHKAFLEERADMPHSSFTADKIAPYAEVRGLRAQEAKQRHITAFLSETGLRRMVGSPALMASSVAHAAALAERPNFDIYVVPDPPPSLENWYDASLFYDKDAVPYAAHVENPALCQVSTNQSDIEPVADWFADLSAAAYGRDESAAFIRSVAVKWAT